MTGVGMILGTAAYVSPEQARGKVVDKRADIWAFGAVFYELITGRKAFAGDDVSETLAKVIQAEPRWDVPIRVRRLLKKCLEKDPKKRLRDIGDVWELLDETAPASGVVVRRSRSWIAGSVAALMAIVAALALWTASRKTAPPPQLLRFQIYPPDKTTFANDIDDPPAVSPDGKHLAFLAMGQDGRSRIWIRDLDSLDARRLDGTEDGLWPFWSSDGRWIAFADGTGAELKKIRVSGGPPQTLCGCPMILKGAWSKAGVIVIGNSQGLMNVSEDGGAATPLSRSPAVDASRDEVVHFLPSFLPDERHFLYSQAGAGQGGLHVGSIDSTPEQQPRDRVLDTFAKYASGRLLMVRGGALMSQEFDVDRFRTIGEATQIGAIAQVQPPASGNGALAYGGTFLAPKQLTWFSREGKALGTIGEPGKIWNPRVSPESVVAFIRYDTGPGDVWLYEPSRGFSQFSFKSDSEGPVWSPDGSHVAFSRLVPGGLMPSRRRQTASGAKNFCTNSATAFSGIGRTTTSI